MKDWKNVWDFLQKNNVIVPDRIEDISSEDITLVFNMGFKCFDYIQNSSLDEKVSCQLRAKDDAIKTAMECVVNESKTSMKEIEAQNKELNIQIQTMSKKYDEQNSLYHLQIKDEVENKIKEECASHHNIIITSLKDQIHTMKEAFDSLKNDKSSLEKRFNEINEKLPHMNMVALGNIGEDIVEQLTLEAFNYECEITSSSKEKHCMDIRVSTLNGFSANLEIKTANPIQSARDVQKYHRDLQELIDKSEINASAFISLRAPIPNFKSGTLVFKTNTVGLKIPIMYIQVSSKELLKHCLILLKDIQQVCQLEHDARGSQPMPMELQKYQDEKKVLKKILPDIFKSNTEEEDELVSQLDHLNRIKEISESRLGRLQVIRQCKTRLIDEIPWLFDESCTKTNKLEKAIAIWEKFKMENKKEPERLSCFGVDEPFIKNIGFARLKEAVRENRKKEKMVD